MRRIAVLAALIGASLIGTGAAQGAVLTSVNGTITYIADQGEKNDVVVGTDAISDPIFGGPVPIYTFTDADAVPIAIGGGPCKPFERGAMCRQDGIGSFIVDVRDRDDTAQISTAGQNGQPPPTILATLIGGDGVDTLMGGFGPDILKGNRGRDSLRGRQGPDVHKGGRGNDTLQTLDGQRDTFISCGEGVRDLLRADKIDPRPRRCEFGGRKPSKRF